MIVRIALPFRIHATACIYYGPRDTQEKRWQAIVMDHNGRLMALYGETCLSYRTKHEAEAAGKRELRKYADHFKTVKPDTEKA